MKTTAKSSNCFFAAAKALQSCNDESVVLFTSALWVDQIVYQCQFKSLPVTNF